MNNNFDSNSHQIANSMLDDLMQSLNLDSHPPNNLEYSHNNLHDSSQLHNLNDHNLNQTGISDLTHSDWADTSHNFSQQPPQSDWVHHSNDTHHADSQWQNPETGFAAATSDRDNHANAVPQVLHSSLSRSGDGPFINIDRSGDVHLHKLDGTTEVVGHVHGRDFYNSGGDHIGYLGKDGHIYRWADDSSVGRVESGHIYRENGKEVGRADTDLEGAAHMLFVVRGGTY
ncbi:hypothetical protein [Kamptonema sp. UHCC 0994]|uniref:hypothetical protein n=1 Tax=Kamptonema sp. UHCC 0994 TaxID=3031329 RepID=UPI0023B90C52|nr:hypothetical protein [Kamptonema sp. UHCC 0994]MDF0553308.1 hypothetical protein [Kamptonema sp. UHCC 0994]